MALGLRGNICLVQRSIRGGFVAITRSEKPHISVRALLESLGGSIAQAYR